MSTVQTYAVAGMSCEHCVAAVTEQLDGLPGVTAVEIELVPDGDSHVTVTSDAALALDEVQAAVDEAGYELTGAAG
jgi:copper chaperone CopZ